MRRFHAAGGYIPRMIHLAHVRDEGLVCYDGNHRRHVFNEDGDDLTCIVDVMFDAQPSDVYAAFNNLNKAVQVPAIYLEDSSVKEEILALVKTYEQDHRAFLSASSRCHCPNFNRDSFIDDVDAIHAYFNGALSIPEIGALLKRLNTAYSNASMGRAHTSFKPAALDKCRKHNFWLFLERHISPQHIEALLT